jgi:nitrogen-specific signal transduction histidine kinase
MAGKSKETNMKAGKLWVENGVIHACVTAREFDLEMAKETTEVGLEIINETGADSLLIDLGECKKISREARKHMENVSENPAVRKIVFLVKNPVTRVLGSFFIGIQNPKVPTKMFGKKEDAIKWLKE